ncbi:hypothetical protein ACU8KH_03413 [Lachancea thermotolerans]
MRHQVPGAVSQMFYMYFTETTPLQNLGFLQKQNGAIKMLYHTSKRGNKSYSLSQWTRNLSNSEVAGVFGSFKAVTSHNVC